MKFLLEKDISAFKFILDNMDFEFAMRINVSTYINLSRYLKKIQKLIGKITNKKPKIKNRANSQSINNGGYNYNYDKYLFVRSSN